MEWRSGSAIENRKYFIQAANTGISAVIDPCGIFVERSKLNEKEPNIIFLSYIWPLLSILFRTGKRPFAIYILITYCSFLLNRSPYGRLHGIISRMYKEKIYAFIDSQNLNLAIKDLGWDLDFSKFHDLLKKKFKVEKAFLFIGYKAGNEPLYTYLQKAGFIVIFKPILISRDGKIIKGNVDAELVLHAMIEYNNYNKAIIVTGDGDFHCLIRYLEENTKLLKLFIPDRNKFSSLLREFANRFVFVNQYEKRLKKISRHLLGTNP